MAKNEKPAPAPGQNKGSSPDKDSGEDAAKQKGKNKKLIIIGALVLAVAGGAGWYFTRGNAGHADAAKAQPAQMEAPKFVVLEPFTVNLQREEGDQFLQVGITLKIVDSKLEEKIKLAMPEIRSRLLMLLSGKYASELTPIDGKKKLAREIIAETEVVLGLRTAPAHPAAQTHKGDGSGAASGVAAAHPDAASAPAEGAVAEDTPAAAPDAGEKSGIVDVLFTSFIIQ